MSASASSIKLRESQNMDLKKKKSSYNNLITRPNLLLTTTHLSVSPLNPGYKQLRNMYTIRITVIVCSDSMSE
jgi:hypothetical protein